MSVKHAFIILILFLLVGCKEKNVYDIKHYKYFNDDEVHVTVALNTGQVKKYLCAFPPNTDYLHMKKIKIVKVKTEKFLGDTIFYCNAFD